MAGLGGYSGRSNFYADRDAKRTALYDSFPACVKRPWRPDFAEAPLRLQPTRPARASTQPTASATPLSDACATGFKSCIKSCIKSCGRHGCWM